MTASTGFTGVAEEVLTELRRKSKLALYRRDPEAWMADVLDGYWWSKQKEIAWSVVDPNKPQTMTIVKSCNGIGKDLPLDTPLPTPTGWTTMGEVRPGDLLLDEQGNPTRVITKSEVFHNPLYQITFDDGTQVVASGTHEWDTIDFRTAKNNRIRLAVSDWRDHWNLAKTRTTEEIRATLKARNGKQVANNHIIPTNRPLHLPEADLPVDPYILGYWLGDGSSADTNVWVFQDSAQVEREFSTRGVELTPRPSDPNCFTFARQGFRDKFRHLGVLNNKHIPPRYLRASETQRLELLRGIMDSDGFRQGKFGAGIDLHNEELSRGVSELVRTLGWKASFKASPSKLYGREVGTRFRIYFTPTQNPFSEWSHKSFSPNRRGQTTIRTMRTIVNVEPTNTVPTQCVSVDSPRNLFLATEKFIPTHNTRIAGDLATYYLATMDPMELSIITTAPVFKQIGLGLFRYINDNYNIALERKYKLPGRFTADPALKVPRIGGGIDKEVIQAKRPADQNLISSFQGIHDGLVLVLMDEAGGLPEDLYIGANAVTTNEYAKILAIGNPDALHTAFHARFTDREKYRDWNPISISAYDSPALTGETVHPDPEKDKRIKSLLVQPAWVEMMERQAHPNVVRAKVHGEFPLDDDTSFFSQFVLNKAYNAEIDPDSVDYSFLGIDLAFGGEDRTVAYLNRGGHIRKHDDLLYEEDFMKVARQIHQMALACGADEVRLDAASSGKGVWSLLEFQSEFANKPYLLVGVLGGTKSPDDTQWAQARAWHYDTFRSRMAQGLIDLDPEDKALKDDATAMTYEINKKGAIQITPKTELRKKGVRSPDHLDAAIYSAIDFSGFTQGPQAGDKVTATAEQMRENMMLENQIQWYGRPGDAF